MPPILPTDRHCVYYKFLYCTVLLYCNSTIQLHMYTTYNVPLTYDIKVDLQWFLPFKNLNSTMK